MSTFAHAQIDETAPRQPLSGAVGVVEPEPGMEKQFARYLPQIGLMSKQLKQTSKLIENSVVEVCNSFQGIAERAKETVGRTASFLGRDADGHSGRRSFEGLIQSCTRTLVRILNTTEEAGEVSRRAITRIQQMDKASQLISKALIQLEQIDRENKMLAMNMRIEAAHAGSAGAGFAVVAVEVVSQTERSQKVTSEVNGLISDLRALAESTLSDLKQMNERDLKRVEECRQEVDESLRDMQAAHDEMKTVLTGMTNEDALLANDIGAAVRGLQFQDRTSQQIAHVVEDLETLQAKLTAGFDASAATGIASEVGFSGYTMREERQVAGIEGMESAAGDVELF
jgi:methyl-accepting chemotaxis protein